MKKNILGLDLGITSIGFAHVIEDDNDSTQSRIERIGVRVNPVSTDEQINFEKGNPISLNASRTLKRSARRNLDRYQLRRQNLIEVLRKAGFITPKTILTENGKNTTHETWRIRAKAAAEKVEKEEFARILLAINKKRGYKSSRKANNEEDGSIIDGMEVARILYEKNITPGQYTYELLKQGKKQIPDFYRSDLRDEFDRIWASQKRYYPEIFTDEFKHDIIGKGQRTTTAAFWNRHRITSADNKGSREEKKMRAYEWRNAALREKLSIEEAIYVIADVNNQIAGSSGYLGSISDRSKELFFKKQTIGQRLYQKLKDNKHCSLKNCVFYRQDYLDEFEKIWEVQSKYHPELTDDLKSEIRDIIIFYQRKLKSQKQLLSFCEFESKTVVIRRNGTEKEQTIGMKVAPKSSPLFQEFKIWQILNSLNFTNKITKEECQLDLDSKKLLFEELNIKGNLSVGTALKYIGYNTSDWDCNYTTLEGNHTNRAMYESFLKIIENEGYDVHDFFKTKPTKDETSISEISIPAAEIKNYIRSIFETLGINIAILDFDAELEGKEFENQASYQLWHLLYSYEGDDSASGNEKLYELLTKKFGFHHDHGKVLANISLVSDYGNLSAKAMRRIYPYIRENKFSTACELAGYRHSASSLTKEEIANKPLKGRLSLLRKNSLRNPVVEKILNQMVNVVNTLIDVNTKKDESGNVVNPFHFDEIRIELARELKKSADERKELYLNINASKARHEQIVKILQTECGVPNPTRNDIIRYKLYAELKNNGFKDLYSNTYIPKENLFDKDIDIDHIIPQSRVFDDSFSNKTLVFRKDNIEKGNRTAYDYISEKYGAEGVAAFIARVEMLHDYGKKNKEEGLSKAKYQKLLKKADAIGDGFIERDLRQTQYIAKKAMLMLSEITRSVVPTTGSITDRLRKDWGLVNIMQELSIEKFRKLGLTEMIEKKDGTFKERIIDWSKRNDHRHHAVDALVVAFTKRSHIQYFNYLNARYNSLHQSHRVVLNIESKETHVERDTEGNSKRLIKLPLPDFREQAKDHLKKVLVSYKAKNKVVTRNLNMIKTKQGVKQKIELTPRGQLHNETIYGKILRPEIKEEKIGAKFNAETIGFVVNPRYKQLLLQRLQENGSDPKKAFTGKNALSKNPIYLDELKTEVVPEKIKIKKYYEEYTIRKEVAPDLNVEKVIDEGVKRILEDRLKEYDNDPKKAFSDLERNPIWINREKGIAVKRVRINAGIKNPNAIHNKKDHLGQLIYDKDGQRIANDFISTGNNHHVAIFIDETGKLRENIVSFLEAVSRATQKLPIVDRNFNSHLGWKFLFTMKQNEFFVFPNESTGFDPNDIDLLNPENSEIISQNLYRVQKLSNGDYVFRHHLETNVEVKSELKNIAYKRCSLAGIKGIKKVRINHIGQIVKVGE